MELNAVDLVLVGLIVFGAGVIQGLIGFGYAVMTVPLLRLVESGLTPVPQVLICVTLAAAGAWRERADIDTRGIGPILIGRVPGSLAGAWLLGLVAASTLDLVTAIVVLAGAAIIAFRVTLHQSILTRLIAGVVSGFTGTASAMSGPPLAFFYQANLRSEARATLGVIFLVGGLVSVWALAIGGVLDWSHVRIAILLEIPTALGFLVSTTWINRVREAPLRRGVLIVSALAGILLGCRGLGWI